MRWGRILIVNILFHWCRLKNFFLFCSDFHIDLAKHTAPWLPAAEQTQPWGDGKPDCVQIRTCSIPPRTICIFFFDFTQIERYADQQRLMRWERNELKQWGPMHSVHPWRLIGLSRLHRTERKRGGGGWRRGDEKHSQKKLIGTDSGHHLPKNAGLSCHVLLFEVWLAFRLTAKALRVCPWLWAAWPRLIPM